MGYDHIDTDAAAESDVTIGHTSGVLSETIVHLWTLLMAAERRILEAGQRVHEGDRCCDPSIPADDGRPSTQRVGTKTVS